MRQIAYQLGIVLLWAPLATSVLRESMSFIVVVRRGISVFMVGRGIEGAEVGGKSLTAGDAGAAWEVVMGANLMNGNRDQYMR